MRFWPGCACCEAVCPNCSGSVPDNLMITLSGIVADYCSLCEQLNNEYTLEYIGDCTWRFFTGAISFCPEGPGGFRNVEIVAELYESGGQYYLSVVLTLSAPACNDVTTWIASLGATKPNCLTMSPTLVFDSRVGTTPCCGQADTPTVQPLSDCGCTYVTRLPDDPWYVTIPELSGSCGSCAGYAGTYELQLSPTTNCLWRYDFFTNNCGSGEETDYIQLKVWPITGDPDGFAIEVSLVINCSGTMITHRFYDSFSGNNCAITDYPLNYYDSSGTSCCDAPESVLVTG